MWRLRHPAVDQQHPVHCTPVSPKAKSDSTERWLSHDKIQPTEGTLGLSWHFESDTLGYKHRPVVFHDLTMRSVYKVLDTQYDSFRYIIPYTTRAKVLLQQLWMKKREWDDPIPLVNSDKHGWSGKMSSVIWSKSSTQDGMKLVYLVP